MASPENTTTTRRAILTGIAAAAAAPAALAVPTSYPYAADADASITVWRAWWGHTIEWHRLAAESRRVWDALPEDVRLPKAKVLEDPGHRKTKVATSRKEIERLTDPNAYRPMGERERARRAVVRDEKLAEFAEREHQAEAYIIASGHRAVAERMSFAAKLAQMHQEQIEAMNVTTPIAIAARCHVALDGLAQYRPAALINETPESRFLAYLIRDLRPHLPADMAAAIAPITDDWRPLVDMWTATPSDRLPAQISGSVV